MVKIAFGKCNLQVQTYDPHIPEYSAFEQIAPLK